jgi:hypothetical protein
MESEEPVRQWFRAQSWLINAVEMTGTVLTELTKKVNLRHFFVPREAVLRTMTANMRDFVCDDNPVNADSTVA